MAALTSTGLFPAGQESYRFSYVVRPPIARGAVTNKMLNSGGSGSGTFYPYTPQFTKFPVNP